MEDQIILTLVKLKHSPTFEMLAAHLCKQQPFITFGCS